MLHGVIDSVVDNYLRVADEVGEDVDMRKISAWVAIAAVPTMIAGIYGMNFQYMLELASPWGYPAVLIGMATVCLLLYRTTPEGDDVAVTTRTQRHAWLDAQLRTLSPDDQRAIARACAPLSTIADS